MSESFFDDDIVRKYFPEKDAASGREPQPEETPPEPADSAPPEAVPEKTAPSTPPEPSIPVPTVEPEPALLQAGPPSEIPTVPEPAKTLFCGNCAAELPPSSSFCPECGAPASMAVSKPVEPTKPTTAPPPAASPVVPPVKSRPVVPPTPEGPKQPVRWPWITLLIGGSILALLFICCSCLLWYIAPEMAADGEYTIEGTRLFALIACLVPGLLLVAAAVFGGVYAFRRPKE